MNMIALNIFVDLITSSATACVILSELGILFRILSATLPAKRWPKAYDFWEAWVWSVFSMPFIILLYNTELFGKFMPLIAFVSGLGVMEIWPQIKNKLNSIGPLIANALLNLRPELASVNNEHIIKAIKPVANGEITNLLLPEIQVPLNMDKQPDVSEVTTIETKPVE